jgi:hypothetical protein
MCTSPSRSAYESGSSPIERAGVRWARTNALPQTALNEFFKGPGATERFSYGWIGIYNGFTGYNRLEVRDGVAHVYLTGACTSEGKDFNIADLIRLNLKQFPEHPVREDLRRERSDPNPRRTKRL